MQIPPGPYISSNFHLFFQYKNYSSYRFKILKAVLLYGIVLVWLYSIYFYASHQYMHAIQRNRFGVYYSATLSLLIIGYGTEVHVQKNSHIIITVLFLLVGFVIQSFVYGKLIYFILTTILFFFYVLQRMFCKFGTSSQMPLAKMKIYFSSSASIWNIRSFRYIWGKKFLPTSISNFSTSFITKLISTEQFLIFSDRYDCMRLFL